MPVLADGNLHFHDDALNVTHIKNPKQLPDLYFQQLLRESASWQSFTSKFGNWYVQFDESSSLPHRAAGQPYFMNVSGGAEHIADAFIQNELSMFSFPKSELTLRSVIHGSKYNFVHYTQNHKGLEVLWSDVYVKMTKQNEVMLFGIQAYNIAIDATPGLTSAQALTFAQNNVPYINKSSGGDLKILPVPAYRKYDYKLVYEFVIENLSPENIPAKYYTLVDANTGEILYRQNQVYHCGPPNANTDITLTGTYYLTNPYSPISTNPLAHVKVTANSVNYFTDVNGLLNLPFTTPTSATFSLEGKWSKIQTNNSTPVFTTTINPGQNAISFNANANDKELSAFHAVGVVHDYMKGFFGSFTGLDYPLPTNIDVSGSCNAFYNGSSINFFNAGGGCNPTSYVADVVYHEYGHGINDKYYQSVGANWNNGAMHEGYADIWALGITESPILGIGFFQNNPNGFVRRYDQNIKVYPQDLVGEVHADGEIIAGCWWDYGQIINDVQGMMELFTATYDAGLTGPTGSEGVLFTDILLEALTQDDNDGNLSNGTPNMIAILTAFDMHGITLITTAQINHTPMQLHAATPITINATVTNLFLPAILNGVRCYYKVNTGAWNYITMTNTSGNNYQGLIPAQAPGTLVSYYLGLEDTTGAVKNVIPLAADAATDPNIPYFMLIDYTDISNEDFDFTFGSWTTGIPSDNATTGLWTIDIPIASYLTAGVPSSQVQTGTQVTSGGLFCALTGNATSANDPAGTNDVDGGTTTLESPVYDLSSYTNPAFSFYRWYTNDQGANPKKDAWKVLISNNGSTWVPVENTHTPDHSWRFYAFRVADYVTPTANVKIRFVAEDIPDPGQNPSGSLIEAAIDDLILYDQLSTGLNESDGPISLNIYPNPANETAFIQISNKNRTGDLKLNMINSIGQIVYSQNISNESESVIKLNVDSYATGIYLITIKGEQINRSIKFNIIK